MNYEDQKQSFAMIVLKRWYWWCRSPIDQTIFFFLLKIMLKLSCIWDPWGIEKAFMTKKALPDRREGMYGKLVCFSIWSTNDPAKKIQSESAFFRPFTKKFSLDQKRGERPLKQSVQDSYPINIFNLNSIFTLCNKHSHFFLSVQKTGKSLSRTTHGVAGIGSRSICDRDLLVLLGQYWIKIFPF